MKRLIILWFIVLLMTGLCGCGSLVVMEEPESTQLVNPVKNVSGKELLELTGVPIDAPEGATDVTYTVIELDGTTAIAQVKFTWDGKAAFFRAQATSELEPGDISGLSYQWEDPVTTTVGHCDASIYLSGDVGYIAWLDIVPGVQYNLGMTAGADAAVLEELANAVFVPLQGDN